MGGLSSNEVARYVAAAAVWAPSVHNTQPWRLRARGCELSLYSDPGRQLALADPAGREMLISCGAALFTARLALRSLGYIPEADVLPDPAQPALVARLTWPRQASVTDFERLLLRQVPRRRTHRGGFDPVPVSAALLDALRGAAARDGATLRILADPGDRARLAAIVATAERAQRMDAARTAELARWAPPPGSRRPDGVPPTAYPARPPQTDPNFPARDFAHGHDWGLLPVISAPRPRSAGVVTLLTTGADQPADWVKAGHALQRVLLTAGLGGVAAALHSQPLELDWLREEVRAGFCAGGYPQLILRLGAVIQIEVSRRRPLDEVFTVVRTASGRGGDGDG
ncbi:MAG TPA: hypothetical protein VMI33_12100 [Streptosporangiaceae bacterium]|nr:hypothetical protein [Streptosporangiaceae bacterium]